MNLHLRPHDLSHCAPVHLGLLDSRFGMSALLEESTVPTGVPGTHGTGPDQDTSVCILLVSSRGSRGEPGDDPETLLIARWQCRTRAEPAQALAMALAAGLQRLARADVDFVTIERPRTVHDYSPAQAEGPCGVFQRAGWSGR